MKAALAQFIFESNTFSPEPAHIDVFKKGGVWLDAEDDVRAWAAGTDSQMHGSLDVLEAAGWRACAREEGRGLWSPHLVSSSAPGFSA